MENILVFNPVQIIFYCVGIIIPTFTLLYTLGNFAFQIGEVKENHKELPIVIVMMLLRMFVIVFGMITCYEVIFHHDLAEFSLRSL